ncbi:unnamed protein product [Rhizoctonia solani]|uniref:Uncharacterized protein n=1 Tax=Rhizoctonia solani TaxID=456999 RepID=A0A8H3ALV2_9AGAM|nr:unnamed protein product [Rhizoctonia solani]
MASRPKLEHRDTLTKDPDPHSYPSLADLRSRQWRRTSRNPFEPSEESTDAAPTPDRLNFGAATAVTSGALGTTGAGGAPGTRRMPTSESYQTKSSVEHAESPLPELRHTEPSGPGSEESEPEYPKLKYPGSMWVHLFYDLAWSSCFASLTQNGKFENPLDTLSYFLFFAAVLWLWASQTLYSIHFYTNDWFNLTSTFLQLFIFGMISATTLGYDVTTYIAHSPGLPTLRDSGDDEITPERFTDEKTAFLSLLVLAIAFTATRIIHLVQYLRVLYYANWSTKARPSPSGGSPQGPWVSQVPPQLIAITVGLLISTPMFGAALGIAASDFGQTVLGASLRFGLWACGFLVEILSHFSMPIYWYIRELRGFEKNGDCLHKLPVSPGLDLYERLQTITTIIFGEGINGLAGTLSAVLVAPGVGRTVAANVVSAACIVWFVAYIYFEGPKGRTAPRISSLRALIWLLLHLPFLASTVLLLIGMKSQFLLTSFLSSLFRTTSRFNDILNRQLLGNNNPAVWRANAEMKRLLVQRGIVWEKEFDDLIDTIRNSTEPQAVITRAWSVRLSLTMVLNVFKDINGGSDDSIPSDIQPSIDEYYKNLTLAFNDSQTMTDDPQNSEYYKIMTGLLDGYILSTRYIIAFAGLILISLSLQDFVHSWPRDRYQWGVIISRFTMGAVFCLLLLLNIGKYQVLFVPPQDLRQRAGVFLWLEAFWVLPTIMITFGVQFLIEIALARFAERATEKAKAAGEKKNNFPESVAANQEKASQQAFP